MSKSLLIRLCLCCVAALMMSSSIQAQAAFGQTDCTSQFTPMPGGGGTYTVCGTTSITGIPTGGGMATVTFDFQRMVNGVWTTFSSPMVTANPNSGTASFVTSNITITPTVGEEYRVKVSGGYRTGSPPNQVNNPVAGVVSLSIIPKP